MGSCLVAGLEGSSGGGRGCSVWGGNVIDCLFFIGVASQLSKIVIHCLDQHRKPDCKYGRITCSEDFKYLARRVN